MVRYGFIFHKLLSQFFECRSADRTLEVADQVRFPRGKSQHIESILSSTTYDTAETRLFDHFAA